MELEVKTLAVVGVQMIAVPVDRKMQETLQWAAAEPAAEPVAGVVMHSEYLEDIEVGQTVAVVALAAIGSAHKIVERMFAEKAG